MEWTLEQAEKMRNGRPTYGDKHKGGALTWLRTGKETGGEYGLLYFELGPGYSISPHYHTVYTEIFQVFEGSLPGRLGDRNISVNSGDEIVVSPRTIHGWGPIREGEVRAVAELRPAHEGFEKWIMMLHGMAVDGLTKPDLRPNSFVHAALFLVESDTHLAGRAQALNPVLQMVAWIARKAGVDRRLEEKYYDPHKGDLSTA